MLALQASIFELRRACRSNGTHINPLSILSHCVLTEFASEIRPGASARRFTKSQNEQFIGRLTVSQRRY